MSRTELRARVAALEQQLAEERRNRVTSEREVSELQAILHTSKSKLGAYLEAQERRTKSGHQIRKLRRHLQRDFHPDKATRFASVPEVLHKLSQKINEVLD